MNEQLTFDLPFRQTVGRDDFFVSASNAQAVAMVDNWPNWPMGKWVLSGPAASGKTHLAHIWTQAVAGRVVPAATIHTDMVNDLCKTPICIDDMHADLSADTQEAVFHLHNRLIEDGTPLLFVGRGAAKDWTLSLPDLISRIAACGMTKIAQPDEALLAAVMVKQFADRQIAIPPRLISYLTPRVERSFEFVTRLVAEIDQQSLTDRKAISQKRVSAVLDRLLASVS